MKAKIRTKAFHLSLPVPVSIAGIAVRLIPERVFGDIRKNTPEPYCSLVTKDTIRIILGECLGILKENKGLEVVHVEAADGTFVSIKL